MPTYETLDAIADAVNPVLLATTLLLPIIPTIRACIGPARWYGLLMAMALVVYGLMYVDGRVGLWPSFGADYSTHTAAATALVGLWSLAGQRLFFAGISILLAYIALMLYQGYHTVLDIVTTVPVIAVLLAGMMRITGRRGFRAVFSTETP